MQSRGQQQYRVKVHLFKKTGKKKKCELPRTTFLRSNNEMYDLHTFNQRHIAELSLRLEPRKVHFGKIVTKGTAHFSVDHILRLQTSLNNYTSWKLCNIANGFLCRRWRQCFKDVPNRIPLVTLCTHSHMTRVGLCVRNHMTRKLNNINDRQFICKKSHDSTSEWRVESKKIKSVRLFAILSRFHSSPMLFALNGQTWTESCITVNLCTLRCTLIETNIIFKFMYSPITWLITVLDEMVNEL